MGSVAKCIPPLRDFHKRLQQWYNQYGRRDLPWRNTGDAYAIYVSEIMLQQTQVETVRTRFYEPFLEKFPSFEALAKASHEDVLSVWQGLGYYRRAGHMHAAAQQAKGVMPDTVEGLLALPGIGKNTAHAVAAFAYRQPVAVMEANLKRVLCRIFALTQPSEVELWEKAGAILNRDDPFDYNQSMMDIGAMICTKRAPKCAECPANAICEGKGNPERYPQAKEKKAVPVRRKNILLYMDRAGKIAASKRSTLFLQGMYHFTELETPAPAQAKKIGEVQQSYSHFTLEAEIYLLRNEKMAGETYSLAQLYDLPMSMAEKKILQILSSHVTQAA